MVSDFCKNGRSCFSRLLRTKHCWKVNRVLVQVEMVIIICHSRLLTCGAQMVRTLDNIITDFKKSL